jgi:hypothetical protein
LELADVDHALHAVGAAVKARVPAQHKTAAASRFA